jgi:hypothetical protein
VPEHLVVAVGGTGQVVLHYYALLYLVGIINEPFHAVVIDTDELNSGLKITKGFLDLLQLGHDKTAGIASRTIPRLEFIPISIHTQSKVSQALAGALPDNVPKNHPARAFFAADVLDQDIARGLFGRPALSSVLTADQLRIPLPPADTTVVVVASLIGGTGGGLITALLDKLRQTKETSVGRSLNLRAVLFGEYFEPDPHVMDLATHRSNLRMCLESLKEKGTQDAIDFFALVGDRKDREFMPERKHGEEKTRRPLWPDADSHPFWRGVQAVYYLLREYTKPIPSDFLDKQVTTSEAGKQAGFDSKGTAEQAKRGMGRAEALVSERVVKQVAADPFAAVVWKRTLVKLLADFWSVSAKQLGKERTADFPGQLQERLDARWQGEEGLCGAFPEFKALGCSLRSFARIDWPEMNPDLVDLSLFNDPNQALERAAANLLFEALRSASHA